MQSEAQAARLLDQSAEKWEGARLKFNAKNGSLTAEKGGKTAMALAPKGAQLLANLPLGIQQKVKTNQFVKVTARVSQNELLSVQV